MLHTHHPPYRRLLGFVEPAPEPSTQGESTFSNSTSGSGSGSGQYSSSNDQPVIIADPSQEPQVGPEDPNTGDSGGVFSTGQGGNGTAHSGQGGEGSSSSSGQGNGQGSHDQGAGQGVNHDPVYGQSGNDTSGHTGQNGSSDNNGGNHEGYNTTLSGQGNNSSNSTNATATANSTATNDTTTTPLPTSSATNNTTSAYPLPTVITNTTVSGTPVNASNATTTPSNGNDTLVASHGDNTSSNVNVGEIIGIVAGSLAGLIIIGYVISTVIKCIQGKRRNLKWIDFDHNNDHKDDVPISSAEAVLTRHRTTSAGMRGGGAGETYDNDKLEENSGLAGIGRVAPHQGYEMNEVHSGTGGLGGSPYGIGPSQQGGPGHYRYANLDGGYDAAHAQWYHNTIQYQQSLAPLPRYDDAGLGNQTYMTGAPHSNSGTGQSLSSPPRSDFGPPLGESDSLGTTMVAPDSAYAEYWGTMGGEEPMPHDASPALSAHRLMGVGAAVPLARSQGHATDNASPSLQAVRNLSFKSGAGHSTSHSHSHSHSHSYANQQVQQRQQGHLEQDPHFDLVLQADAAGAGKGHSRDESASESALPGGRLGNLRVVNAEPDSDRE